MQTRLKLHNKYIRWQGNRWRFHEYYRLKPDTVMRIEGVVMIENGLPEFIHCETKIEKRDQLSQLQESCGAQDVSRRELATIISSFKQ